MIGVGQKGHLGGSCSIADMVAVLYFHKMNIDPSNPGWEKRDRFLLRKGHPALKQGISIAYGMAAGLRINGNPSRVYCILGDGELAESVRGKPKIIIAHTVKGNGVSFAEQNAAFHNIQLARA